MKSREALEAAIEDMRARYGDWSYDIPLPFALWTRGGLELPHTRLKRLLQAVSDLCAKPLAECRILDLGCLDGMFSIEFALHGAEAVGIEVREANVKKAQFCKEALGLGNLEFYQDDARNISIESYGRFDAIVCSGLLYHLTAADAAGLLETMFAMTTRLLLIDTHIALRPREKTVIDGEVYWGRSFVEHASGAGESEKARALWASADNPSSFWFTRPSLINLVQRAGFSSIYECFAPTHLNFGKPGLETVDRCTFAAIKAEACALKTAPAANTLRERWPEHSLSYGSNPFARHRVARLVRRASARLARRKP